MASVVPAEHTGTAGTPREPADAQSSQNQKRELSPDHTSPWAKRPRRDVIDLTDKEIDGPERERDVPPTAGHQSSSSFFDLSGDTPSVVVPPVASTEASAAGTTSHGDPTQASQAPAKIEGSHPTHQDVGGTEDAAAALGQRADGLYKSIDDSLVWLSESRYHRPQTRSRRDALVLLRAIRANIESKAACDLRQAVARFVSASSEKDVRRLLREDVYDILRRLELFVCNGDPELVFRPLPGQEYDPKPRVSGDLHMARTIHQQAKHHMQTLPPSRGVGKHPLDFNDPESPTLRFSFNKFVGGLYLGDIDNFLRAMSYQEYKTFSSIPSADFGARVLLLYKEAKLIARREEMYAIEDIFDRGLQGDIQYLRTQARRGADVAPELRAAQDRYYTCRGKLWPYLETMSHAQLAAFRKYPAATKAHCLGVYLKTQNTAATATATTAAAAAVTAGGSASGTHPQATDTMFTHLGPPCGMEFDPLRMLDDIAARTRQMDTGGPGPGMPGDPAEFDRFLEEVQADEERDENEGTNTAQEVVDAAAELEAADAGDLKFSMPGMVCHLHPHQVIGVAWMAKREHLKDDDGKRSKVRGGVLADSMGLGKTVQALGVMMKNRPPGARRPTATATAAASKKPRCTLIVCPVALVHQWAREIATKAPGLFDVQVHHGATKLRTVAEIQKYDVVITSYGTLAREYPVRKWKKTPTAAEREEDAERIDRDKGPLFRMRFFRLILDEAHTIKNPGANVSVACCNLDAMRQWCLTGTPFQNKVDDIYPLLKVLGVPYFHDRRTFMSEISKHRDGARKLRAVLAPFLKRRTKDDVIAGRPVLQLPEKTVKMISLEFDKDETALYEQVQSQMVSEINKYLREGTAVKKISHMFTMLLRLRQLCLHPYLILDHLATKNGIDHAQFIRDSTGVQSLSALLAGELADSADCIVCGICQTEASDPVISDTCYHCFCKACIVHDSDSEVTACPVCSKRIGNLIPFAAQSHAAAAPIADDPVDGEGVPSGPRPKAEPTTSRESSPAASRASVEDFKTNVEPYSGSTRSATAPSHVSKPGTITLDDSDDEELPELSMRAVLNREVKVKSEPSERVAGSASSTRIKGEPSDVAGPVVGGSPRLEGERLSASTRHPTGTASSPPQSGAAVETSDEKKPALQSAVTPRYIVHPSDAQESAPGSKPDAAQRKLDGESWKELLKLDFIPSTKFSAVEKQLAEWMTTDDSKLIVFSQFVKALDLLNKICDQNGWQTLRYQGDMNMREREATIQQFEQPEGPRILLMSLKAGGVGLNLVCANKVMMLDFWWNAAAEHQAVDRCHRMGQTKEVVVCRMYLPGTVEERILALQEEKLKTAGAVLGENEEGGKMARLNMRELMGLFGKVTRGADGVQQIE